MNTFAIDREDDVVAALATPPRNTINVYPLVGLGLTLFAAMAVYGGIYYSLLN